MIQYSEEFSKKTFTAKDQKTAYLNAMKWYATNVLAKDELHEVHLIIEKDKQSPSVTLHLLVSMSKDKLDERHCAICWESHKHFFINENCNCDWCNCKAYSRREEEMLQTKKEYYREKIRKYL